MSQAAPRQCRATYDAELGRWRISTSPTPLGVGGAGQPSRGITNLRLAQLGDDVLLLAEPSTGHLELLIDDAGDRRHLGPAATHAVRRFVGRMPDDIGPNGATVLGDREWRRLALAFDTFASTTGDVRRWAAAECVVQLDRLDLADAAEPDIAGAAHELRGTKPVDVRVAESASAIVASLRLNVTVAEIEPAAAAATSQRAVSEQVAPAGRIVSASSTDDNHAAAHNHAAADNHAATHDHHAVANGHAETNGPHVAWLASEFISYPVVDLSRPCPVFRRDGNLIVHIDPDTTTYASTLRELTLAVIESDTDILVGVAPLTLGFDDDHAVATARVVVGESRATADLEVVLLDADRPVPANPRRTAAANAFARRRAERARRLGDELVAAAWGGMLGDNTADSPSELPLVADGALPMPRRGPR